MNVYQEVVKELKKLDVSKEVVYHCSQIAFELSVLAESMSVQDLAQYCINNYKNT